MLSFQEFLNKYNGQSGVGNTAINKGQCVGLASVWQDNLGVPHEWGDAKDFLNNADKNYFDVILNTPTGVPQKGDIVVWGEKYNGTFGHIAIATGSGDTNSLEVFEQNNPLGSNCHLGRHNYNNVLGWLRLKAQPPAGGGLPPNYADIIRKASNWDEVEKMGYFTIAALKQALNKDELNQLKEKLRKIHDLSS